MSFLFEGWVIYLFVFLIVALVLYLYFKKINNVSAVVKEKINKAKEFGLYEPVSLHPVIDMNKCIGSGACIAVCPEQDILGWMKGKGATINASQCVGHGACFHSCPVEAITLVMGTEKRGVELPHVKPNYETNVSGIYIAGELGGMGLIKNAVEQGTLAIASITSNIPKNHNADYDLLIIGAGPAGIGASLAAKKNNLKFKTVEQDTLGGTVFTFPRAKIVMTSPMELPLYGNVKLVETSKTELLELWRDVLSKNQITISENEKVNSISKSKVIFDIETNKGKYSAATVLLAIGRRGTPRKLGVTGENYEKVAYRLLEPERIKEKKVLVVGGGDSAIESAMLLASEGNEVTLSYRKNNFSRIKPRNLERINNAIDNNELSVLFESNVKEITDTEVVIKKDGDENNLILENDLVYVFAGGELPNQFLQSIGIEVTKKFGEAVLKH
ncbi:MAG: NAD(P)-binding domain-containing protein [Melioribacteraceae bacterium]|nr:NAD(P)-binding domain-containing protein [Melioribacteraceae bacterium]MCF8263699.1 NAD(P)-binding domain-containing protein [Melioribacteraceae bacterium]MCF8431925.1 NAD(P)-binding domain-containing protein [Melioribacteraceae bacterium]